METITLFNKIKLRKWQVSVIICITAFILNCILCEIPIVHQSLINGYQHDMMKNSFLFLFFFMGIGSLIETLLFCNFALWLLGKFI